MPGGATDGLVSVVIPTYHRNDLLRDAIDSALGQRYDPVEVILVDDSGTANAAPVVEEYDEVRYVALDDNRGPHPARSLGAERAAGAYVQFLDDDDVLHEEKFRKQVPLFSDSVGVVYSGIRKYESGEVVLPAPDVRGDVLEHTLLLDRSFPICTCSMLVQRSVLDRILPLKNCHGADDEGMKNELALRTEFDFVAEPLVDLRYDTAYSLGGSWANVAGRWEILDRYADLYDQFPPRVRRTVVADTYVQAGNKHLRESGWSAAAIAAFAKAAYHAPDQKSRHLARCFASLFGNAGRELAASALARVEGAERGDG